MAITYVAVSIEAAATLTTMPTHQTGDLLVAFAYRFTSNITPTGPSGWNAHNGGAASGGRSGIIGWKIAESSSETSGTWTNADILAIGCYRSDTGKVLVIGSSAVNTGNGLASIQYGAVAAASFLGVSNSWAIGVAGTSTNDVADTAPTGMTNRSSLVGTGEVGWHDTNGHITSWSLQSVATTSVGYRSYVIPVLETSIDIPGGGSGGVPLIGTGGLVY